MAATAILCSKPCSLQNADKTYTDGIFYVYQALARFTPRGGGAKLDLAIEDIQGQKRSKANPLLMIETKGQGKPVLKFVSTDDRDAAVAAIEQARAPAADASAAQPASAAPAAGAGGGAGGGAVSAPGAARMTSSLAAGTAAGVDLGVKLSVEQRKLLLANNKAIAAQHQTLVTDSQALTDDEFWASAAVQRAAGLTGMPGPTARSSRKGLANRLIDLAKQTQTKDGQVVQLKMTSEDEQQLLAENPALRQLYEAQVPNMMTKGDFWGRYLKYYMAKKDKRNKATNKFKRLQQNLAADSAAIVGDMAGDEAAGDEAQQLEVLFSMVETGNTLDAETRRALKRRLNPVLDLASAAEDRLTADGYGLAHNAARSEVESMEGYQSLSSQLLQDYNVHSATVIGQHVQAAAAAKKPPVAGSSSAAAAAPAAGVEDSEMTEAEAQRYRHNAGIVLEDLQAPPQQQFEQLRVTDPRLYFKSMQQQQQPLSLSQQQQGDVSVKQQPDLVAAIGGIDPGNLLDPPVTSSIARQVLQELTSADVGGGGRGGPASLPQEYLDFVQQQSMVIDELLRHFWGLLPVNTNEKKAKFLRIQKSMDVCYEVLNKRIEQADHGQKHTLTRLVKPLWEQLDNSITAAKNVERELQRKQQQSQQRRLQSSR